MHKLDVTQQAIKKLSSNQILSQGNMNQKQFFQRRNQVSLQQKTSATSNTRSLPRLNKSFVSSQQTSRFSSPNKKIDAQYSDQSNNNIKEEIAIRRTPTTRKSQPNVDILRLSLNVMQLTVNDPIPENIEFSKLDETLNLVVPAGAKKRRQRNKQLDTLADVNIMEFHGISSQQRAKFIDWMIQVFRVLKRGSIKTFLNAAFLLDKYYKIKKYSGIQISRKDFQLIGLTLILICSKFEDSEPITIHQILFEASHGKYHSAQIFQKEQEILQTLDYRFHVESYYDLASQGLYQLTNQFKLLEISELDKKIVQKIVNFISQLIVMQTEIFQSDPEQLSQAIQWLTLRYMKYYYRQKCFSTNEDENDTAIIKDSKGLKNLDAFEQLTKQFKQQVALKQKIKYKRLMIRIINFYDNLEESHPGIKNIYKSYKLFFTNESRQILLNCLPKMKVKRLKSR
ncbi:UNKNOWN [Stylonychia lemnae]|uniref:Cyclin N-terminal domain-containing protein n=1 Tax=Stylonychia lemnae TaxID=5949 RepID=A0A078AQP7_STYLE|nr:UNKNOWN [Stylonychia lemnae]|eukprot:CDW84529.1 UNKNOWN [Stylonychia lemnae]